MAGIRPKPRSAPVLPILLGINIAALWVVITLWGAINSLFAILVGR